MPSFRAGGEPTGSAPPWPPFCWPPFCWPPARLPSSSAPFRRPRRSRPALAAALPVPAAPPAWDTDLAATPRKGQYLRYFRMKATAYAPIDTRMEGGRYTKTQRDGRSAHGVAVDPRLIPLGSQLWIPGYGHAVADDIGGAIRGHHVDVRVQIPGHMGQWGVRPVRVYVLQEPPGP